MGESDTAFDTCLTEAIWKPWAFWFLSQVIWHC